MQSRFAPLLLIIVVTGAASGKSPEHRWEYILFEPVERCAGVVPDFIVGCGDKSHGLRLDVKGLGPEFFKTNRLTARLHRGNGQVIEAESNLLNSPLGIGHLSSVNWSVMAFIPWGTNSLRESWIEVGVAGDRYWLEIPYGFDRDPRQPLPDSVWEGFPTFCPAMKKSSQDHVIRWKSVHYDFGKIQNGWRLSVIQSNPGDGEPEVELYRDDGVVGKSIYLWDLHTPRTSVRVLEANQRVAGARCMGIRLHEDGMRRSDTYVLGQTGYDRRSWGEFEITVADHSYKTVIPSSLYEYAHGHAPEAFGTGAHICIFSHKL